MACACSAARSAEASATHLCRDHALEILLHAQPIHQGKAGRVAQNLGRTAIGPTVHLHRVARRQRNDDQPLRRAGGGSRRRRRDQSRPGHSEAPDLARWNHRETGSLGIRHQQLSQPAGTSNRRAHREPHPNLRPERHRLRRLGNGLGLGSGRDRRCPPGRAATQNEIRQGGDRRRAAPSPGSSQISARCRNPVRGGGR